MSRPHPTPARPGPPPVSGVILAAGASTRLGRPKQTLELWGKPVLQQVVDATAGAALHEVIVVLGHHCSAVAGALELPPGARIVENPDYAAGQSTSLRTGLDACDRVSGAAAILLGDQPGITAGVIDAVLDAYRSGGAPVVRAVFEGVPGHPVVVDRALWTSWRAVVGDRGGRDLLAGAPQLVDVAMGRPPLPDIDTLDQYEALQLSGPPGTR